MPEYNCEGGAYVPQFESWKKTEKRKIRQAANWIGLSFLGYIAVSVITANVAYIIYSLMNPRISLFGISVPESVEQIIELLAYSLSMIIPFLIYIAALKMPFGVALPFRKAKADLTFGGVFVGLGVTVIAQYVTYFIQVIASFSGVSLTMPDYDMPESEGAAFLYTVTLTVLAAVLEEMAFRGCIMQSLRRFGDDFALIVSAMVFGIFHLNLIQMPYAFILGVCIGFFVMKTGSIWVGILIHLANNGFTVLFEYLMERVTTEEYIMLYNLYDICAVVMGTVFVIIFGIKYKKFYKLYPFHSGISAGKRVWYFVSSPLLIIGFVIACIMTASYVSVG